MANPIKTLSKVTTLAGATVAKLGDHAPGIKSLAQALPQGIVSSPAAAVTGASGHVSPEVARALTRVEGNQTPYQLQTDTTELFDIFTTTIGESRSFYTTNRWIRVTLTLQTAGPVVVATRADVVPVNTGKGASLMPGVPLTMTLPRGSTLYYGCASVQRFSVVVEPIPWANEIAGKIDDVASALGVAARGIIGALQRR